MDFISILSIFVLPKFNFNVLNFVPGDHIGQLEQLFNRWERQVVFVVNVYDDIDAAM